MKKFIPTLFFLLGLGLHAQVGVGTTNPQSTLDIEASNTTNPTNTDGILVPRIDNFSISNPTATQDGMLVFYTGSGASGKGFYYWDNSTTTWIYLSSGSKNTLDQAYDEGGAGAGRTITADTGAVIIEGGGGLRVESSAQTSMLNVHGANNAVGIGESNPTSPLHVGVSTTFNLLRPNSGQDGIFIKGGDDNSGLDAIGASISFGGAATTRANGRKSAIALVQTSSFVDQNGLAFYVHPSNANSDPMSEGMRLTHQKYLGINNTSPSATLDVVGTMQFVDGNEATGYVLSSDALGNASWTNPSTLFTDTNTTYDGTDFALSNQTLPSGQFVIGINSAGNIIGGIDQDNQNLTSATLTGTTLNLAIENGTGTSVNLASLQDGIGTDDQNLTLSGTTLSIEDGNNVDLSIIQDGTGTDNQNLTSATLTGTTLSLGIEDGTGTSVNLAALQDGTGTDNQNLTSATLTGTTLNLAIENGTGASVNLATLQDGTGTDDQNLTSATLTGTTLNLAIENGTGTSVNLASLQDGTGTDDQNLTSATLTGTTLNLGIENGSGASVNLAALQDGTGTDNQNLTSATLTGTTLNLAIENGTGTSVNLAALQDGTGTDDQNIQNLSFNNSTNILTVGIENGTAQTVNLSTLNTGGDITQITAGSGMTGGGTTGAITLNAYGTNGLLTYADDIRLGGTLTQNTQIALAAQTFDINLNSTGDFAIQDAGTDVFFVENTGDIGIGNSNPAYPLHITESVNGTTRGLFIDKTDNSGDETSGLYIEKTGNGSGRSHAIFTDIDGTGDGQKYGVFNRITSSANGSQYGTRNFLNGATSSSQFATFNNLANNATGNQYGVYNGMRGINASNLYGVFNEFSYSFSGVNEITGIKNQFSGGNPGTTEGSTGIFSTFSTPANGTYYGVRNVFSAGATGTGTKYGTYNIIDNSAGGTHYGTYNNVATSNGWAGYFLGKAYVSNKLGVGTGAGDPDGFVEVRANNSGAQPNINLVDIGDSGARINFSNTDTTNGNVWTLFGDTENTAANSRFNIYHPTGGNIIQIMGNGLVGINRAPTTNSLEVSGNASKNTAGGWLANSDRRLKKNINTIDSEYALNKLLALRGVTYEWDDDKTGINRPEELQYGFIAQELMEVFPEKVTKDNLGFYQTAYGDYDAVFVQAIKALNTKIETLETENKILKEKLSKLEALEARILALENNNTINSTKNETASAIKD